MSLHETYAALIRRGMPKHPHLVWHDRSDDALGISVVQWALCSLPTHDCADGVEAVLISPDLLTEELARDLITMHALRWFVKLKDRYVSVDAIQAVAGQAYGGITEFGVTILDAILAATEHLEPEEEK